MPRLSLWRPQRQSNDYKFFDRVIKQMYTVGGVDLLFHKYLGPQINDPGGNTDATTPVYPESNPLFIEDLLLLENRDRKYDDSVYVMRGCYQESDVDFDLTQFGLFLNGDTKFITIHYNDMIDVFGRKVMSGDVIEFPNLADYHPLDTSIMKALPRYYVVQDANWASEGFSQTWLPHLWRLKCTPMVNAQEYNDILNKPFEPNNIWDPGNFYPEGTIVQDGDKYYTAKGDVPPGTAIGDPNYWTPIDNPTTIGDKDSTRNKDLQINDAILTQAKVEVPLSGFDTVKFFILPTSADGQPQPTISNPLIDQTAASPRADGYTLGYMTGDGIAPNGLPVTPGVQFPPNPKVGDYALRLDYFPNRLFRFNGNAWIKIEENVRTDMYLNEGANTQRSSFVNNTFTTPTTDLGNVPSRQSLSQALKPRADNGDQGGHKPAKPYPDNQPGQPPFPGQ